MQHNEKRIDRSENEQQDLEDQEHIPGRIGVIYSVFVQRKEDRKEYVQHGDGHERCEKDPSDMEKGPPEYTLIVQISDQVPRPQ